MTNKAKHKNFIISNDITIKHGILLVWEPYSQPHVHRKRAMQTAKGPLHSRPGHTRCPRARQKCGPCHQYHQPYERWVTQNMVEPCNAKQKNGFFTLSTFTFIQFEMRLQTFAPSFPSRGSFSGDTARGGDWSPYSPTRQLRRLVQIHERVR